MRDNKKKKILPYKTSAELYYKIGLRYEDEKKYLDALKYFIKAANMQPFNADYQLNIAGVLTEIGDYKESNKILAGILKNIDDSLSECYFCMACNYFDLGEFKKAASYFKKYIEMSPDGCFIAEASNAIYYIELYEGQWDTCIKQESINNKGKRAYKQERQQDNKIIYLNSYTDFPEDLEIFDEVIDLQNDLFKKIGYKWEQAVNWAIYNKEPEYDNSYDREIEDICLSVITKLSSKNKPVIRKFEVWAAVFEYIYCMKNQIKVQKAQIASKYNISVSTISYKLKQLGY